MLVFHVSLETNFYRIHPHPHSVFWKRQIKQVLYFKILPPFNEYSHSMNIAMVDKSIEREQKFMHGLKSKIHISVEYK